MLYILSDSDFVRLDPDGVVLVDTRQSASGFADGSAMRGDPLTPHSLENVGSKELRTITEEMKRA